MPQAQEEDKPRQTSVVPDMLAYVGTAIATTATMWVTIRETLYSNLKKAGLFKAIEERRNKPLGSLAEKVAETEGNDLIANARLLKGKEHNVSYAKEVDQLIKKIGFTNSWKKFVHLNFSQQVGIVITGMGLATVAVGAIIGIRHQREINSNLKEINRKEESGQSFKAKETGRRTKNQAADISAGMT